ncbi:hypothetical protein AMATHDRAFT_152756 [Amanita thiersii Skay4041]|uniref:E3 ubiquitin-protein ligase n=1 Tax=Amanita thiersii Skay4041 TaxID=703135 RepID=A0A2A9NHD8_9AGAR|nr:hypothetical protein AMATHDRAFT_152756 [Amanita thiersii Skay4041]
MASSRDRPSDPLSHLRFVLETMPGSRKYVFTPATRAEILSELYDAFWGQYAHLFLPNSNTSLPLHHTLNEVQVSLGFSGAGQPDPPYPGKICGQIIGKGESCFRCRDCGLDESCVMCSQCFHATDHINHNVSFFVSQQPGGCCDCGDEEAWKKPMNCPYHPPQLKKDDPDDLSQVTPKSSARMIAPEVPPVPNYPYRTNVPPDLRDSMHRTVGYALDFILDTFDYSPDEPSIPPNEADLRLQPSADPMLKDQYCVVLWNDDKHSFDEVIKLLCELTNRTRDEAAALAQRIDETGRDIIEMNSNIPRLLDIAQTLNHIDLGVTVRRAYDTFREQVAEVIIEWLLDLSQCRMSMDTLILREVIAVELLSPRKRESNPYSQSAIALKEISEPTRLDYMFIYHTRLWKKPRLSCKELYASIIALSHPHKITLASRFAGVYHRIVDSYLLIDREAETSIKYLALQLFTVPSVACHVVRNYNLVDRLLSIITAFFTNQIQDKRIAYPPATPTAVDADSQPFKSKRFMPVFSDLRYLVVTDHVQDMIAQNLEFITQFARTCQLFMCINPNKRAVTSHVEYEADAWISVFNVTLSLSRVVKAYGEAFSRATTIKLLAAIAIVMANITLVINLEQGCLDSTKFSPIMYHDVTFGDEEYTIVDFNVLDGWVSFHHSLHWLLAELFKHVDLLEDQQLEEIELGSFRQMMVQEQDEESLLAIFDFPLRVLAMIAQIRTGLWVRNGFAIRGQLLHYRDYMLRELCYDQDVYIIQTSLAILNPNVVFVSILDRYGLLNFFGGVTLHETYEGAQLSSMVEEVLYLLITILSENANASKLSMESVVRREIIHALVLGPCTFTELSKRVAERVTAFVGFDRTLGIVANFKAPETSTDTGMYELKDEMYDEVNPFFYHYTRNKREEVENILMNRLRKKGIQDPVIVPKSFGVTKGPYVVIPCAFESEVLIQVMFYAVFNVLVMTEESGSTPPSGEAIMGQAVHLVMLALVERAAQFSSLVTARTFAEDKCLLDMLCELEHHEKYKVYKAHVAWILDHLAQHIPGEVSSRRKVITKTGPTASEAEDAKKRAVKARQEAIMQKMKAQQVSFAVNFDDLDDEDDEMEEEAEEQIAYGTCIVCQEDLTPSKAFGALGLLQPSRLIRKQPEGQNAYLGEVLQQVPSLDRNVPSPYGNTFPPSESNDTRLMSLTTFEGFPTSYTRFGLHASVCTHMMHVECFQVYNTSIRQRHRTQSSRNHPENIPRKEYICPLCKSLGNMMLPMSPPCKNPLSTVPFPDWIRAAGISILKSKPDPHLESLQFKNGTGEFVFWAAQDSGYANALRIHEQTEGSEVVKIADTVMSVAKMYSQQTRHLRDRPEQDSGERGTGLYLPEELVGYTISAIETAQRGTGAQGGGMMVDNLTEAQMRMIRSLLATLGKLASLHFKKRADEGREGIKQAIIKRLLPEWSRTSLSSFSYPLLLRDPLSILVETAVVAPEILGHVLVLTYYACLARTAVGLVYLLNKARNYTHMPAGRRMYEDLFGDVRMFFISVVRHSPVFEHMTTVAFETFGEARIEKLLYAFTLPFLRRASILCRSVLPSAFPTPPKPAAGVAGVKAEQTEYARLLTMLGIPPLSDLPNQDTLQNALSGWCAHYGHSQAVSQLNCGISLDFPGIYKLPKLPIALDNLFAAPNAKALTCVRCKTVPADAAICLICGAACCMQSNCCQDVDNEKGECNMHTRECGGMAGIFFLVKRCSLLYLYAGNGTFMASPYLDIHGETDISMRRGRRQFLHYARWEEVRKMWLNHAIPTVVARRLEGTLDTGGWETL